MSTSLRVIYMGTPEFAVSGLRAILASRHHVVGVVSTPDKPAGRGKKLRPSAIKEEAVRAKLPLLQPAKLNSPETINAIEALNPDVIVVVAFRMLPKAIWSIPRLGTFNLHASLLPNYRGAAPIHWSIINGEKETGLTTFLIDDKIDTGAILFQEKLAIQKEETTGELSLRMQALSGPLIIKTLAALADGTAQSNPQQNAENLMPAPKLSRENTRINWSLSGQAIVNLIHGLNPFPTAWSILEAENQEIYIKIKRAHFVAGKPIHKPGTLSLEDDKLSISVIDGYVYIEELQLPNKKSMKTTVLLHGYQFPANSRFI
jgi:methionyl-tRNA formyltransferase